MNVRVFKTIAMVMLAVNESWALWAIVYDYVFTASDFPVILDGQFTSVLRVKICCICDSRLVSVFLTPFIDVLKEKHCKTL
jgi:hypothetical protein